MAEMHPDIRFILETQWELLDALAALAYHDNPGRIAGICTDRQKLIDEYLQRPYQKMYKPRRYSQQPQPTQPPQPPLPSHAYAQLQQRKQRIQQGEPPSQVYKPQHKAYDGSSYPPEPQKETAKQKEQKQQSNEMGEMEDY